MIVHRISLRQLPMRPSPCSRFCFLQRHSPLPPRAGGLPWESSFSKILASIQGMAPKFATIAFLIAGVIWMLGESGSMGRKDLGLVVRGTIAFGIEAECRLNGQ